jgi:RNA polymerase sigma-70 factor (ECF subfamily)
VSPEPATPATDEQLVDRFLAGDRAAFDELVRRHQRPIYYLALRYVGNHAEAQDVTQRAMVQAFQRLSSFRRQAQFRVWLFRIAVNLSLNALRDGRQRRRATVEPEPRAPVEATPEPVEERETRLRVLQAVAQLPRKQRAAVELRAFQELAFAEVAEILECSEDAAKVNYHHGLRRLRELLDEGGAR